MIVHWLLFSWLLFANIFEGQCVTQTSSLENQEASADSRFQYFQACLNGNRTKDEHFLEKSTKANELNPDISLWGKRWQNGASSSINTFFGFFNSSVGLKNVALEYSSSPFVLITGKSSIMMDSCISRQKSASPFHLQSGSICLTNMSMLHANGIYSSSLVFSSDGSNSVILRNSVISNLAVSASDNFLLSGKSKSEQINDCTFRNISVKPFKSSDYLMEHSCFRSSMENCLIYSCVNIFEGGISSGAFSSQEFVCKNISSHFGKREANELERKQRIDTTESQSFSLCEWVDCTSPYGGALYVHDNANAILIVENSSFTRCSASSTRGGGIYAQKIAECIVLHSSFDQCAAFGTSDFGGGGIEFESINVQPMVEDCLFNNCSAANDGGALSYFEIMTQKQKHCIINSFFRICRANDSLTGTGGAIIHWNPLDKVVISNCLFCHCYSMCWGGAVGILISQYNQGVLLYFCFFHNNTCVKYGHDVLLQDSTSSNIDSSCYSTRQTSNRVCANLYSIVDRSEWLRNDFGRVRFVSSNETQPNSKDTYACGLDESHACSTISRCLTQLIPDLVPNVEVFSGTIIETNCFDCGANTFSVYGQSNMSTAIQIEFEISGLSLFSVSTGILSVRDFILMHDSSHSNNRWSRLFEITGTGEMHISRLNISTGSEYFSETAFTTEMINVQGGMMRMEHVNWAKTISTTSLFSLSSTNEISLALSECSFDGIERTTSGSAVMSFSNDKANIDLNLCTFEGCGSTTSADGGSMMLCAGNENEVKVKDGAFDGCFCSSSNGLGGGILLRLLNENPDFLISSSFGTNTAKWGRDIFVLSPNLEETATSRKIACVTSSSDSVDKVRGYDNGNTSVAIPLCIYLLPSPSEICVNNIEATDHSHCGIVQFPCLTMKHSLTRQTETKKVVVSGMILMSDELAFEEQKHEIKGNDDQSGWTVSDASSPLNSAMITASVETELSKLIFSLPSSLSSRSTFISSSSSSLTLSQCSLTLQDPSSELAFLFLSVESGILIIDKFSASSIALSGSPLISLSGSSTEAEFMNTPWLNMTNSNFTEIERAAGNGSCVSIDNSHDENSNGEINIEECDFDGCSVAGDGSRGGAINAKLKGNTQLNIVSCTFTGCTAPAGEEKNGFGGGMALKLIDDDSSFVISSPVFDADKPNIAKYGNDVFVESSNLTKSITNTSLPFVSGHLADISLNSLRGFDGNDTTNVIPLIYFWQAIGSEIYIGDKGKDMHACGFSDYPCLSIDYSLMRLSEGNERNVSIIGKGYLRKSVDVSGASIKSKDSSSICSLECVSSLEGAEGAAMKIQGMAHFELINFAITSSFASGVNVLMHVGSSEGLLTVKDCSFTKMKESGEDMINYGLIKAEGGTVVLDFVTMQLLSFSQDVISVLSATILRIKNLTMKNVELEGASGLSITKSSRRENNEIEQNIVIEWSLFEEVTQNITNDIPIIRNEIDDKPLKIVIRNTTMKGCGGKRCGKGGGMFCVLNEGGSFDCSFCTISECFCSSTGRGGWLFLECTSTAEQPLNFVLSNITFRDNSALRGRDVYIRCHSIDAQIVDEQFLLDFRVPFVKELAMWGCTTDSFVDEEDLLLRVMIYQSETIYVSSVADNHTDSKQCGEFNAPCRSLSFGVQHIIPSLYSQLLISEESVINRECDARDVIIRSLKSPSVALVYLNSTIGDDEGSLIRTSGNVRIERLKFNIGKVFSYSGSSIIHEANGQLSLSFVDFSSIEESNGIETIVLNSTLLSIESGILHVDNCSVSLLSFKKPSFLLSGDEISLTNVKLEQIESMANVFELGQCGGVVFNGACADGVKLSEGCIIGISSSTSGTISIGSTSFKNCSRNSEGASVLSASSSSAEIVLSNCSCESCNSLSDKGGIINVNELRNASMNLCQFSGMVAKESKNDNMNTITDICEWNGSLVHLSNTSLMTKDVSILNASSGGMSLSSGNVTIEKGEFFDNNPFIEKYPSLRRNIICSDSASLTISSLKGGDGVMPNSSLWILNDGCTLGGIAGERASPFFIPVLESVETREKGEEREVMFKGKLLLPCNLSFRLVYKTGDVEFVETYEFEENSFVSETEVIGTLPSDKITTVADETEVSVMILFGEKDAPSSTELCIVKNRSDGVASEGVVAKENKKTEWSLIAFIAVAVVLVVVVLTFVAICGIRGRNGISNGKRWSETDSGNKSTTADSEEEKSEEEHEGGLEFIEMPSELQEGVTSESQLLIEEESSRLLKADEIMNRNGVRADILTAFCSGDFAEAQTVLPVLVDQKDGNAVVGFSNGGGTDLKKKKKKEKKRKGRKENLESKENDLEATYDIEDIENRKVQFSEIKTTSERFRRSSEEEIQKEKLFENSHVSCKETNLGFSDFGDEQNEMKDFAVNNSSVSFEGSGEIADAAMANEGPIAKDSKTSVLLNEVFEARGSEVSTDFYNAEEGIVDGRFEDCEIINQEEKVQKKKKKKKRKQKHENIDVVDQMVDET